MRQRIKHLPGAGTVNIKTSQTTRFAGL